MKPLKYASVGVDIQRIKGIHESIYPMMMKTYSNRKGLVGRPLPVVGHYAGLIDLGKSGLLALHVDGVGTKVVIAQMLRRYDTIGIDCIAMCVNDIICTGAEPLSFMDYIALEKENGGLVKAVMKGLVNGARDARISIIGGETAILGDVIKGDHGDGFDLAGMAVGLAKRKDLVMGDKIRPGDTIIGLESSGIHSNGLTLARKVMLNRFSLDHKFADSDIPLGESLITPTRIYVKPILELLKNFNVHGLAHITGGGFVKLIRLKNEVGFRLDTMPEGDQIFHEIRKAGKLSLVEMYRTFNMGIGFCVILPKDQVEQCVSLCEKYDIPATIVGSIVKGQGVSIGKMRIC